MPTLPLDALDLAPFEGYATFNHGFDDESFSVFGSPAKLTLKGLREVPKTFEPTTKEHHQLAGLLGQLDKLGSARAIADFFYDEGVRGRRRDSNNCPVQKWLRIMTGRDYQVGNAFVYDQSGRAVACMPAAASRFVCEFDLGQHSRLALPTG